MDVVTNILVVFVPVMPRSNSLKDSVSSCVSIVIMELFKDPGFVFFGVNESPWNVHLVFLPLEMPIPNTIYSRWPLFSAWRNLL